MAGIVRASGANAGRIYIAGALDNTGANLAFAANTGSFLLNGGTITGGTLTSSGSNTLIGVGGGTLAAEAGSGKIVLNGTFYLGTVGPEVAATVALTGNLELNGTLVVHGRSTLRFQGAAGTTQTVFTTAPAGFLSFGAFGGNVQQSGGAHTVEFGPNVTLSGPGNVGTADFVGTWVNRGTFSGSEPNLALTLGDRVGNTFANAVGGVWRATGATLSIGGAWQNLGSMLTDATGVLELRGTFATADIGAAGWSRGAVR